MISVLYRIDCPCKVQSLTRRCFGFNNASELCTQTGIHWHLRMSCRESIAEVCVCTSVLTAILTVTAVKSAFSLEHYLRKICFIRHHCLTFMGVATFDRLAALLDGRCKIRPVPPERRRIIIDTRLDIFLPFLQRLGVPKRDWTHIHHLLSGNMLRMTKTTVAQMSMNADRSKIDLGLVDVHPECRLIAYHRSQLLPKMFPYIGTSKVPCSVI